jgi:hypothetical protein
MTEEQIKKGNKLLEQINSLEAMAKQIMVTREYMEVYIPDLEEEKVKEWKEMNRDFFTEEAERLKKEFEKL